MTECEEVLAPAGEERQGAEAALLNRGTTVPLSPSKITLPQWLGTSNVDDSFLKIQTRKQQLAHLLGLHGNPTPPRLKKKTNEIAKHGAE